MTKFKAAFALLAVFVILAAPAYAGSANAPFVASDDAGSAFFRSGATGGDVSNLQMVRPGTERST